ncbi:MAG: hypothetical protein J6U95_07625 [Alistipes sp.]|nr:hypothetical protein [Alistipes sp.]
MLTKIDKKNDNLKPKMEKSGVLRMGLFYGRDGTNGIDEIDGSAEIGRLGNLRRLRKGYH